METEPSKRGFFQKFFGTSLPNPVPIGIAPILAAAAAPPASATVPTAAPTSSAAAAGAAGWCYSPALHRFKCSSLLQRNALRELQCHYYV